MMKTSPSQGSHSGCCRSRFALDHITIGLYPVTHQVTSVLLNAFFVFASSDSLCL